MDNKTIRRGIVAALLIFLGVATFVYFSQQEKSTNTITEKDPNLSQEDRKIYEDRLAEGMKKLSEAKTDEERYEAYISIGQQKYGLGKYAEAKAAYESAVQYNTMNQVGVYSFLYQVEVDMQDNVSARISILKAIELSKGIADSWLKYIILEKDRFKTDNNTLLKIYEDALNATNGTQNQVDILTSYAQFLESVGQKDNAIENWEKAMVLFPEYKTIYQAEIDRIRAQQ